MSRNDGRPRSLPAYSPEGDEIANRARAREARHAGVRAQIANDAAAAALDARAYVPGDRLSFARAQEIAADAAARALDAYRGKL